MSDSKSRTDILAFKRVLRLLGQSVEEKNTAHGHGSIAYLETSSQRKTNNKSSTGDQK